MKIGNAPSHQPLSPKQLQVTGDGVYQKLDGSNTDTLAGCQPSIEADAEIY